MDFLKNSVVRFQNDVLMSNVVFRKGWRETRRKFRGFARKLGFNDFLHFVKTRSQVDNNGLHGKDCLKQRYR